MVCSQLGLPKSKVKEALDLRADFAKQCIEGGMSYRIPHFGLFKPKHSRIYERVKKPKKDKPDSNDTNSNDNGKA